MLESLARLSLKALIYLRMQADMYFYVFFSLKMGKLKLGEYKNFLSEIRYSSAVERLSELG